MLETKNVIISSFKQDRVKRKRTINLRNNRIVYSTTFGVIPSFMRSVFNPVNHL